MAALPPAPRIDGGPRGMVVVCSFLSSWPAARGCGMDRRVPPCRRVPAATLAQVVSPPDLAADLCHGGRIGVATCRSEVPSEEACGQAVTARVVVFGVWRWCFLWWAPLRGGASTSMVGGVACGTPGVGDR
jgi:hypothetical protein